MDDQRIDWDGGRRPPMKRFQFSLRTIFLAFVAVALAFIQYQVAASLLRNRHIADQLTIKAEIARLSVERNIATDRAQKYSNGLARASMDMHIQSIDEQIAGLEEKLDGAPPAAANQPVFD